MYPPKSASKVVLKDVLFAIKELKETYRYEIVNYICKSKKLDSYGGKWAHSLVHYLNILSRANIITTGRKRFGKKRSFGTIVRDVYFYNPNIKDWRVPERS